MSYSKFSKRHEFTLGATANTYAGELATPYVSAATLSAPTIKEGRCRLIEGVVDKAVISEFVSDDPIVAASCNFASQNNISFDEQVLTLSDLKVNEEICREQIFPTWMAANGKMQRDGDIPVDYSNFLMAHVAAKTGEHLEKLMWQGDTGSIFGTGFLSTDGVIDDNVTGIGGSACKGFQEYDHGVTISAANIDDVLQGTWNAVAGLNPALFQKPGFGFYVNWETYGFYLQYLSSTGTGFNNQVSNQSFNNVQYNGVNVYPTLGIPNSVDAIVATYPENLVVGTNNYTPDIQAKLIPTYQYDGSDNIRIAMNFGVGVQTAVPTDGVVAFNFI